MISEGLYHNKHLNKSPEFSSEATTEDLRVREVASHLKQAATRTGCTGSGRHSCTQAQDSRCFHDFVDDSIFHACEYFYKKCIPYKC